MILDSRNSSKDENQSLETIIKFPQITRLRFYFRPFNETVLQRLLDSLPSIKHFSIDTLIYKTDHIRAPFWTLLLQQRLPLLERIRLVVRGWYTVKENDPIDENLIYGYQFDRYWRDRAAKKTFTYRTKYDSTVLQIR